MSRKPHKWEVQVQSGKTGQITNRTVEAHWDPEHELTQESVLTAASCQAYITSGPVHERRDSFVSLTAKLVDKAAA